MTTEVVLETESVIDAPDTAGAPRGARRRPSTHWPTALAALALLILATWALFPDWWSSHDSAEGIPSEKFLGPSATHWFGTDFLGRDVFSRVVHGTNSSLVAALISVSIAVLIGVALGLASALGPRWADTVIGRLADVLFAIPGFLLALIIVTSLGFSTRNAAIAVGIASIPLFVRQTRSEVLKVKNLSFIESSYLIGGSQVAIVGRHILPNIYRGILALMVINFGSALINIAGLAFLGYADPPPAADWGVLLAEGREYISLAPWIVYFPGLAIVLSVLSINQVSKLIGGRR